MVELEEVEDAEFERPQPGPFNPLMNEEDDDDADFTDTDSSMSTTSLPSNTALNETLSERLLALKDMVSPSTRRYITNTSSQIASLVKSSAIWGGKGMWVLSTSALLVAIPWALAFADEQQVLEQEAELKARELAGEVLTPGATTLQPGQQQSRPAL